MLQFDPPPVDHGLLRSGFALQPRALAYAIAQHGKRTGQRAEFIAAIDA